MLGQEWEIVRVRWNWRVKLSGERQERIRKSKTTEVVELEKKDWWEEQERVDWLAK